MEDNDPNRPETEEDGIRAEATGPDQGLVSVAERYAAANGIDLRRQAVHAEVDDDLGRRIYKAYEEMKHSP